MRVQSSQEPIGFRFNIAEMVERSRARSQAAVNEFLREEIARQEQIGAQRRELMDAEWLARALNEKA